MTHPAPPAGLKQAFGVGASGSGSVVPWQVPSNIDGDLYVTLTGAAGGSTGKYNSPTGSVVNAALGGDGGKVAGWATITAGELLYVIGGMPGASNYVGLPGNTSTTARRLGGVPGGGDGGASAPGHGTFASAAGGGYSAVTRTTPSLTHCIALAAGGGGAGSPTAALTVGIVGGDGGADTGAGGSSSTGTTSPTGGSQTTGGAGGVGGVLTGQAGSFGIGGDGAPYGSQVPGAGFMPGGGAGAGYFGGGGAGEETGGFRSTSGAAGSNFHGGLNDIIVNSRGGGGVPDTLAWSSVQHAWRQMGGVVFAWFVVPSKPVLDMPSSGTGVDEAAAIGCAWTFTSDDPTDIQSDAQLRWRPAGGGAWTTVTALGTAETYSFGAGVLAAYDGQQIEWQVRTAGTNAALGTFGAWSDSSYFTPRPAMTDPTLTLDSTDIQSQTITGNVADSTAFQYMQVDVNVDAAGSPGASLAGYPHNLDLGSSPTTSARLVETPSTAFIPAASYHVRVRVASYSGVWSAWIDSGPLVADLNAPLAPSAVVSASTDYASVTVVITNPLAGVDPFPAISNELYRTDLTKGTPEQLIANVIPNGTYVDWLAPINCNLRYRVIAYSASDTGTSSP